MLVHLKGGPFHDTHVRHHLFDRAGVATLAFSDPVAFPPKVDFYVYELDNAEDATAQYRGTRAECVASVADPRVVAAFRNASDQDVVELITGLSGQPRSTRPKLEE